MVHMWAMDIQICNFKVQSCIMITSIQKWWGRDRAFFKPLSFCRFGVSDDLHPCENFSFHPLSQVMFFQLPATPMKRQIILERTMPIAYVGHMRWTACGCFARLCVRMPTFWKRMYRRAPWWKRRLRLGASWWQDVTWVEMMSQSPCSWN